MYMKPGDVSQPAMMDDVKKTLGWRKAFVEGRLADCGLVELCEKMAGEKMADCSQIQSFDLPTGVEQLLSPDPDRTTFFAEIAVLQEFRGKGIASAMIEKMHKDVGAGMVYCYTKNKGHMREILQNIGYAPIFQYGPIFLDSTSFVMMGRSI
jgi:ribosomal protein S18 acetylase RimI-like enzyme